MFRVSSEQCLAISASQPKWLTDVLHSYATDSHAQDLLTKLSVRSDAVPHFSLRDELLRYKSRLWVGNDPSLRLQLITAMHSGLIGRRSGVPVTYRPMRQHFAWTGMKTAVHDFISSCQVCQQAKPDRSKLPGLLALLPVPDRAWKVVSLDFIEGLPLSAGFNSILMVVSFLNMLIFWLRKHPFTAASVAKLFMSQVYRLHGRPSALVSDRDWIFTSALWRELFSLARVELCMSSAYHPQSDGQTERVKQCRTFLRCYVHACPWQW